MSRPQLTAPAISARDAAMIRPLARRTVRETAHLLLDLPVGVAGFSFLVSALAAGVSLAITLVGVPILAAALLATRYAAGAERARARALLGVSVAAPPAPATGSSWWSRMVALLRDTAAWRASGYFLLLFPTGTVMFTAAVVWWSSTLFLLTLPAWAWALPHGGPQIGDATWSAPWQLAASSAAGALCLAATPFVVHAITQADRALLRLLGPVSSER